MRVDQFVDAFQGGGVRVQLSWDRLDSSEFSATHTVSRSTGLLGSLFTVWYEGQQGGNSDWRRAAHPLRVSEASRTEPDWPANRRHRVSSFEKEFVQAREPIQLVLPTYALHDGGLLLLDGTHRAVAAHRASVPVRLLIYTLRGPVHQDVLPDLRHHTARVPPSGPGTSVG
ncbi:hypothetical protein ACIHCQ_38225 [Streptomyces sp. NPDC052236]|uniref:hypothetical protein n=1 Tax=Streptomyces sp. NPDC052236 TaxID=3365686 RepID=UPI0037CDFBFB